ncbi:hypothetical protein H2200_006144 [Cladophialophora chaetospira]|uniref:Cytochrome P450 n=1 Tax=Cladophialophora chaetospira TaxID=386627 RepID=A0AA38XAK9_9EURO|nr:hypothetical protein H2200_006144 [Cladophialophora chaetospira]
MTSSDEYDEISPSIFNSIALSPFRLLIFLLLLALIVAVIRRRIAMDAALPDLPWVARNDKAWLLRDFRLRLWCSMNYEEALKMAYDQYARHSKPCILATLDGEVVLLPPSSTQWMISQPETVLSVKGAHKHILQTKYTFPRPEIMDPTVHFDVIKSELTRQVFTVTPEVCDELKEAVDQLWGIEPDPEEDEEIEKGGWKTVVLFDSMTKIVARMSNRVFVGLPLCRDEKYLKNAIGFAEDIAISATVLRLFPGMIRSLVAPIATYNNRKHTREYTRILTPEILRRQRLQYQLPDIEKDLKSENKPEAVTLDEEDQKNDFLQWLLTRSKTKSYTNPDEADPNIICARLLHTNFASVHTTSFIGTNALLDILASPHNEHVLETLRKEALETMDGEHSLWTRHSLTKMLYLDSALRESSRRASIVGVGINQTVTAPGGVTTPEGWHLPEGCMVATHSWGNHNDENLYPEADKYKPFRFIELRDKIPDTAQSAEQADKEKAYLDKAHLSFIATSPSYLGFGHGRHACPGRFFAAQELKLLLAYLLTRYEIQMVMEGGLGGNWNRKGVRPECFWAGPNHVPPTGAKVRVRRRKEFR